MEQPIQKELETIGKVTGDINGVKLNVNNQVAKGMELFADKVKEGHLVIVGAVYDFADDMKQGAGNLNIININGETDPAKFNAATPVAKKDEHAHH